MAVSPGDNPSAVPIAFSSSLQDDVWHEERGAGSFEAWHFDALSDDGRQALIISFYDNYPFSPRYYLDDRVLPSVSRRCPAVSLVYSVDGNIAVSAVNEFEPNEISPSTGIGCAIGKSRFTARSAEYGTGYVLDVDLVTSRKRHLTAELEWLSIEADLLSPAAETSSLAAWNIISPRSDVTGRITITAPGGETKNVFHIRGTGCHDHLRCPEPLDANVALRCWGRVHFVDCTAFVQCVTLNSGERYSTVYLVRDGKIEERQVLMVSMGTHRSRFGLKFPREARFDAADGTSLVVQPLRSIDSGFSEIKMVARMALSDGGKLHEGEGVIAFLTPARARRRLIRRLSGLKIGANGKPPLF